MCGQSRLHGEGLPKSIFRWIGGNEDVFELTFDTVGPGTITNDSGFYAEGDVIDLEAIADAGNEFQFWTTDPSDLGEFDDMNDPNTTFTMPAEDVTIIATFLDAESRERDADDWEVDQTGGAGVTIDTWDISGLNFQTGDEINFLFNALSVPDRFTVWYGNELIFESGWVSRNPGSYGEPQYPGGVTAHDDHPNVVINNELSSNGGKYEAIIVYDGTDEITVRAEGIESGTAWIYRLETN